MNRREEAEGIVKLVLCDALAVDEEDITPDARLGPDLGAESIDYLDIRLKLEQRTGAIISLENSPFTRLAPYIAGSENLRGGIYTEAGMERLHKEMKPFYDGLTEDQRARLDDTREHAYFAQEVNVRGLIGYVESLLERRDEPRPAATVSSR